jgi:thiol-disulfide isomerase/thioredoxin
MRCIVKIITGVILLISIFTASAHNTDTHQAVLEFEQAMAKHKGKIVYLDFWASWCVPCRKSFPWMNAIKRQYQQQGLVVMSVNLDADAELAKNFLQQTPADFAIIYDAKGSLAKKFKLKGMPSSYLFNRQGKLINVHVGFNDKKKLKYQKEIEQALTD